jgi:hypothetical protein
LRQVVDIRLELAGRTKVLRLCQTLPHLSKLTLFYRPRDVCIGLSNESCRWQGDPSRSQRRTSLQRPRLSHTPRTASLRCPGLP